MFYLLRSSSPSKTSTLGWFCYKNWANPSYGLFYQRYEYFFKSVLMLSVFLTIKFKLQEILDIENLTLKFALDSTK